MDRGGRPADGQPLGDLGIAQTLHHQGQNLELAGSQIVSRGRAFVRGTGGPDQRLGCFGGQGGFAGVGRLDGSLQLVGAYILQQVADGACLEGLVHQVFLLEAGQGDDLDLGPALTDLADGGRPVHHRHDQVHQDHVGRRVFAPVQRIQPILGLPNKLQIVHDQDERRQPLADHGMVVDD